MRRFAGWLLDLIALDRDPKPPFACCIRWHRPGEVRLPGGRHVPTDCVRRGCPVYEAATRR